MEMLGGKDISPECRKPEIMADAAYVILTRDAANYTGNFAIDEAILKVSLRYELLISCFRLSKWLPPQDTLHCHPFKTTNGVGHHAG